MTSQDPTEPSEKTPNQALAELAVAELKTSGFVTDRKLAEMTNKLAAGTATRDDWRVWIELTLDSPTEGGGDGAR